ncbi:MAG: DNA-3-methyladenine glycosylase 2 family protein [Saccharofermentans sp.]|nr:DNA-3-methyladenine glycosylase 2 family protein [Saccharofermentans sp.]
MFTTKLNFFDPYKIALSGQAFRIHPIDDSHVETVAMGRYLQIASLGNNEFAFSCSEDEFESIWKDYFDLNRDYEAIYNTIEDDAYLKAAADYGYGIRILKQDPWEAIISYIISQRRSIPSITTCVDRLSELCGTQVSMPALGEPFVRSLKDVYYAFPSVEQMSGLSPEDLANIGAGYRGPYITSAVNDFASGKLTREMMDSADDDTLLALLLNMFGVGIKVTNCVMLFAFARTGRFPIDVWIQRIMDRYYGGAFDASRYPDTAGIMQQFMFYYERCEKSHLLET